MPAKTFSRLTLGILLGCIAGVALTQEPAGPVTEQVQKPRPPGVIELRQQAEKAHEAGDHEGYLEAVNRLHELRPYNSDYMYQVVLASALAGDHPQAYNMMLHMQQQGLAADFDLAPETEPIRGTEAYIYINDLLKMAGEPVGHARALFDLPESVVLTTSIVWDQSREAFLVGTAREGVVYAVTREGETREVLRANDDNGMWGIYGLLLDPKKNRLWVASSANAYFKGFEQADAGRSALFEFNLETLEPVHRYPVPADGRPHRLGGLALTPGGDLFAVDTILPIIYRLEQGGDRLLPFLASADMVSLRGVAQDEQNGLLYLADYEMGIMVLDLAGKRAMKLQVPANLNLGGIEGLFFWNGHLVMIQNGISPQRIMRMTLSADGVTVTDIAPLAVAQPIFDFPNFGTVLDGELYFFANSHWVRSKEKPGPIRLARTSIAEAPVLQTPDMDEIWKNYQQRSRDGAAPQQD